MRGNLDRAIINCGGRSSNQVLVRKTDRYLGVSCEDPYTHRASLEVVAISALDAQLIRKVSIFIIENYFCMAHELTEIIGTTPSPHWAVLQGSNRTFHT